MRPTAALIAATLALGTGACDLPEDQFPVTASRARMEPYRPIPPGTAPQGTGARLAAEARPRPVTLSQLERGRSRYEIFCAPCHGWAGYGDGLVVRRGFPAPPSFHDDRNLEIAPERVFEAVSHGVGKMYGFEERVSPEDRWAIAFYVKALQLSQRPDRAKAPPNTRTPSP